MCRQVLAAVKGQLAGSLKKRFKSGLLPVRPTATQVVDIDRWSTAFGYNLKWNGRPGQAGNRGAKNLVSSEDILYGRFE
jgi:hypothetical protein